MTDPSATDPVTQLLAVLIEAYPHPPMEAARLGVYRRFLWGKALTSEECHRALDVVLSDPERKFFPTTGVILGAARPAPTSADLAELYDAIETSICWRKGTLASVEATYGLAARRAVQAAGGVNAVKDWRGAGRVFTLKAFIDAYLECPAEQRTALPPGEADSRVTALTTGVVKALSGGPR